MKDIISGLNKAFDNRLRLGIMSVLAVNDQVDFNTLKDLLNATDGNLASHLKALELINYVLVKKKFVGRKPNTTYFITESGKIAFDAHLKSLTLIINNMNQ